MNSLPEMVPATAANPCPVCKKPDWCLIAPDGSACLCQRTESAKRCGDAGWLHKLAEPVPPPAKAKKSKPSKPTNWQAEAERFAKNLAGAPKYLEALAVKLGLPVAALDSIPLLGFRNCGSESVEFTLPEMNAEGTIIGIATRTEAKGKKAKKWFIYGGKRGLTLPEGWRDLPGPVFVVEGPSDVLAMRAAGLKAIGRPSCNSGRKLLAELFAGWEGEIIIVGENDENGAGLKGAKLISRKLSEDLARPVPFALPPDGSNDVRVWLTAEERGETPWHERGEELVALLTANATNAEPPAEGEAAITPRTGRKIIIGTDEFRVNDEACAALAKEADLYERGGQLVAVVEQREEAAAEAAIRRPVGAPVVRPLTTASLRERLTRCARFVQLKETEEGIVERQEHPPYWCTNAVFDRGYWPVPRLEAIVTHPAFLANGSLLSATGFDPASGLYVFLEAKLEVNVPEHPTREDVARAVETLEDIIADFPFQTLAHKAAWFAALLSPLAWFGFDGPAPLFLIDGNVRGVGKGLLADVIALIVFGRRFATMAYTNDREELRKKITSLALEGERAVLLDNLAGAVGNDVFDNALTSAFWKDRILGGNRNYEGPLHLTWFGTGNNVQLGADTSRRVCHIRMESAEERPELKGNFRYKELRKHVRKHRGKLLAAALTILRGWHVAGRPAHNLPPWGSFEGWSGIVREAIVFAGLPDPGLTREELQRHSDRDAGSMETILEAIQRLDPTRHGLTAAELIQRCQDEPAANAELRGAIEELCGKLCGRKLGGRFKHFQRRNFGGKMLDKAGADRTKTNRWAALTVGTDANPPETAPASPASPADNPPDAGNAGNAGGIPGEDAPASAKPSKKRTYRNNPNREEGGAA
jgi:hypothetical protein